jgi:hypothetical protein
MTPQRVREKGGNGNPIEKPIRTFGWKSEDAFNDYVGAIINEIPNMNDRNRFEKKISMFAERGAWDSIEKLLQENRLDDAEYKFKRMGGDSGPRGMWVQKGYSVLNEDGTYSKVDKEQVKTLTALTENYKSTHKNTTKPGYYKNAPTMLGTTRVLNPFGKYVESYEGVQGYGNMAELEAQQQAGVGGAALNAERRNRNSPATQAYDQRNQ